MKALIGVFAGLLISPTISPAAWAHAQNLQSANEPGFETGDSFTATDYRGHVTVLCEDPTDHRSYFYSCRTESLLPAPTARFVAQPGTNADHVTLISRWENGKTYSKEGRFDSESGKSITNFNLWIATLFQRPLLTYGTNQIHYVLSKNGQPQAQGDFVATVQKAPAQTCRDDVLTELNASSCHNGPWMCQRYFDEVARCGGN
jgi:hypothetical protein